MSLQMHQPVTAISGVGEKRAALLKKLGIETVYDLVRHFPRTYIDFSAATPLGGCCIGDTVTVRASVLQKNAPLRVRGGMTIFRALVADEEQSVMTVTYFNNRFAFEALRLGKTYRFHGKLSGTLLRPEMSSPLSIPDEEECALQPVYRLTQGVSSKSLAGHVRRALEGLDSVPCTCLPQKILEAEGFSNDLSLLYDLHFPKNLSDAQAARLPFLLEELLCLQLAMAALQRKSRRAAALTLKSFDLSEFWAALPFSPTNAQRRVVDTALRDLKSGRSMNRLLQGDVGSGKTLCAAALIYAVCKAGGQCAFMAPTEILAVQHCKTLTKMLTPFGISVALITGSTTAAQRRQLLADLESGVIGVVCGTHALIEKKVIFHRLALVVADEQHRFGVAQRAALIAKGTCPHTLIMSATPIPRSLALTIYGDLDISVLDELPLGRKKIKTYLIDNTIRERAYGFLEKEMAAGRQVYIVCPAVEDSESDLISVLSYFDKLQEVFPARRIGLLHGKMPGKQKDAVMSAFHDGQLDLLVSTTVVEVGVDVPNASIMMIENAERFGLSQLHQLRGRVGRGSFQSYCILISDTEGERAAERLKVLCKTADGFEIAQYDLKQRGPGDFFGDRQHGLPPLKIAELLSDTQLLEKAQRYAAKILQDDPRLAAPDHAALKGQVNHMFRTLSNGREN